MMPGRRRTVVAAATAAGNAAVVAIVATAFGSTVAATDVAGGLESDTNLLDSGTVDVVGEDADEGDEDEEGNEEFAADVNDASAFASSGCPTRAGAAASSARLDALSSPADAATAASAASAATPLPSAI